MVQEVRDMHAAQRQSGSVIIYVIVGVFLAAAAVGAVIVAQHRSGQLIATQPADNSSQQRDQDDDASSNADSNTDTSEKSEAEQKREQEREEKEKAAAEEKKAAEEAERKAEEEQAAKERAAAQREAESDAAEEEQSAAQTGPMARTGGSQTAANLPETGPVEDTLGMVVGMIAILGAGYVYYHATRRG